MSGKKVAVGLVIGVVIVIALIMFAVISFFANNPTQEQAVGDNEMTGRIVAIAEQGVLVVSGTPEELEDINEQSVVDSGLPAVWFGVTLDQQNQLKVGQEVEVTFNVLAESYPGQSTAITIRPVME
ncbi:DUF3221 domain-containing protein [Chryseomicrobium sp. FSL W7-1435]|uniref:DUF3221 domain-containing protein n=1 Tax=Chryseomicrobium sp. FSL W7-1435 TaxID=2921704 RepID=UPI003159CB30